MTWLAAITSFLSAFGGPLTAILGAGFGSLITYFVGQWISHRQAQASAITTMDQDMDAHSSDGALSVSDMQSAQGQLQDLQAQAAVLDQQPIQPTKGT